MKFNCSLFMMFPLLIICCLILGCQNIPISNIIYPEPPIDPDCTAVGGCFGLNIEPLEPEPDDSDEDALASN